MNCPSCGLQTVAEQKFCRSCGANLELTTQPLAGSALTPGNTPAVLLKDEKQRPNALVLWGFIMMFIGVAIGAIGKKLMHEEIVTVIGILLSLAGMFLTAYPYLLPAPNKKPRPGLPGPPQVLASSPALKSLPPDREVEYVTSVTERTTDLLQNAGAAVPSRKHEEPRKLSN